MAEAEVTAERFAAVDGRSKNPEARNKRPDEDRAKAAGVRPEPAEVKAGGLRQDAAATVEAAATVRGYESDGRYALALTQRLAIREARRRGAPAVLLMEDDVVFHPNFHALIGTVELTADWGIFYLGCAHSQRPEWAGARVVRVRHVVDTHAVAIRAPYYRRVMMMLDRHGKPDLGVARASDQFLALLHREIPTYACYPNLVWQDVSPSDLMMNVYSNYTEDGRQKNWGGAVAGLLREAVGGENPETRDQRQKGDQIEAAKGNKNAYGKMPQPRLGLLFLTRGDVNHPEIWREFVAEAPGRVRVFSHPKFPGQLKRGFLDGTAIRERHETKWGDISLVRAMLLAALEDQSLTHFALLSEACVPVRPLPEILKRLELDPRPQFGFKTLKEAVARHASRIGAVPEVPAGCWRFSSQWWLLDRTAAIFAAGQDYTPLFEKMFVPDEAYFATVLAMQGYPLEGEVVKKDVTWTWWEKDAGSPNEWPELPLERQEGLLHSGALFARKFPKGADIGKLGLHRSLAIACG